MPPPPPALRPAQQQVRDEEHAVYLEKEADAAGAIDACERAIAALKESKSDLGGKAELEALVQVRTVARTALALSTQLALSESQALPPCGQVLGYAVGGRRSAALT